MVDRGIPPVVYAPTFTDDAGDDRLRMHEMQDGRVALFVYSAMDRLEEQYGEGSPWVLMSRAHLERAHEAIPFDLLLLDRELYPVGAR
jgi:hypothetical protein